MRMLRTIVALCIPFDCGLRPRGWETAVTDGTVGVCAVGRVERDT